MGNKGDKWGDRGGEIKDRNILLMESCELATTFNIAEQSTTLS